MLCGRAFSFSGSLERSLIWARSNYRIDVLTRTDGERERGREGERERGREGVTCCKSTSPIVAGLKILESLGGHFMIMFLYMSEYLKRRNISDDASMATTMGALKSGASTA
jgi:hypothetical protein